MSQVKINKFDGTGMDNGLYVARGLRLLKSFKLNANWDSCRLNEDSCRPRLIAMLHEESRLNDLHPERPPLFPPWSTFKLLNVLNCSWKKMNSRCCVQFAYE